MKPNLHYGEDDCPVSASNGLPKENELHFEIEMVDFFKGNVRMSIGNPLHFNHIFWTYQILICCLITFFFFFSVITRKFFLLPNWMYLYHGLVTLSINLTISLICMIADR